MELPQTINEIFVETLPDYVITKAFHKVNDILPENQVPLSIQSTTSINQALEIMLKNDYSQLPVFIGKRVLGVFSFRSFSSNLHEIKKLSIDLENIPASEFVEQVEFIGIRDDITKSLDKLNIKDVLFIGNRDDFKGLITPIDLVRYLYKLSNPFIFLGEIETAIREILDICTTPEVLDHMIHIALKGKYGDNKLPNSSSEMTFFDYVLIIRRGDNWSFFERAFGAGDFVRRRTETKLTELDYLRNDVFHFRREISEDDVNKLIAHRDWLENVLITLEEKKLEISHAR